MFDQFLDYYNSMLKVISWNKLNPDLVYWMKELLYQLFHK